LVEPLLVVRRAIREQVGILHRRLLVIVQEQCCALRPFRNMLRQNRLTGDWALRRAANACHDVD
jgi:hypothetical protein